MKLKNVIWAMAAMAGLSAVAGEPFSIPGPNGELSCVIDCPRLSEGQKVPMVIICHGFTGNKDDKFLETISDSLLVDGIASIRFDFDGHGHSGGRFEDMTVPKEVADALTILQYVRSLPYVSEIGMAGHSQGGVVTAMTAGTVGDKAIRAVALLAPAAVLRDDALRGIIMGRSYNPHDVPDAGIPLWGGLTLGKEYVETAQTLPIYEMAERYHGPALIIHGTYDTVVPYTYGERFHKIWPGSELVLMPGVDHGFSGHYAEAAALVAKFMKKNL